MNARTPQGDFADWGYDEVLALLRKSDAWHETRRKGLGGSDATILMSGNDDAIMNLWREKRGEAESEDLSGIQPVIFGTITEPLNRYFYTLTTGRRVDGAGAQSTHDQYKFMGVSLDGVTTTELGKRAVLECKCVNAFAKMDEVVEKYTAQCHHAMMITGFDYAILSVFFGTLKYEYVEIQRDDWFLAQLIDREKAFWACVQSGDTPVDMPAVEVPVAPEKLRTVDMQGNNAWAAAAADWTEHGTAAKTFEKAAKSLKAMTEKDVGEASGHSVVVKRAKNNSLRITEMKET